MDMTKVEQLHAKIIKHIQTLKRELDRLSVREAALERSKRAILLQKGDDTTEEENESFEEIVANIEAIIYDLTSFKDQLRERTVHTERGLRLVLLHSDDKDTAVLYQYILEGAELCVRDAAAARSGYDELIANINDITHSRDL